MGTAIVIPFAGQKPASAFLDPNEPIESLADGIGSSYAVLGYKGKVWSLRYRGEKHTFIRSDDGSPTNHIDVIILRQAHAKSKSFYQDSFVEGASDGKRPVCASLDGVTPDAEYQPPQSNTCTLCPKNVWKTNAEGRKSRDCADYKRLAVLLLPNVTKQMLGTPLMEAVFLRVPPASLNELVTFGETMASQGFPFHSFVTRISFNPEKPHPEMVFRPLQALKNEEAPVVLPLRNDPLTKRITGEDQVTRPLLPAATNGAAVIGAPQTVAKPAPAAPQDTGLGLAPAPQPAPAASVAPQSIKPDVAQTIVQEPAVQPASTQTTTSPSEGVATGFLELTANPEPVQQGQPAQNTVADVGEATESDAALDDKIAQLLATS